LADPQPLVERLGRDFFRQLPEAPGVYLMRDGSDAVLYVGKAKNLRKRLSSYRVANPERMPGRLLQLLYRVNRIDCEQCSDESSALARESELLLSLRPRYNRAGVWPAPTRFLAWRTTTDALEIALAETPQDGWHTHGPLRGGVVPMRTSLVRVIWCVMQPERGMTGMPAGWFHGRLPERTAIRTTSMVLHQASVCLKELTTGKHDKFLAWVQNSASPESHSCQRTVLEEDVERIVNFFSRDARNPLQSSTPASSSMAAIVSSALPSSRLLT
jgi:predicted GIY-YIG superfamily endonuclease